MWRGNRSDRDTAADGAELRRWVGLLATLFLVVSAGCGSPLDGPTRQETLTPAPVPAGDQGQTTVTGRLPPGLTSVGVANASALAAAHARALEGQSYTVLSNNSVRYANGTLRTRAAARFALAADRTRYRYAVDAVVRQGRAGESRTHVRVWAAPNRTVRRVRANGTVCYFSNDTPRGGGLQPPIDAAGRSTIERLFTVTDPSVVSMRRQNDRSLYLLRWNGTANPGAVGPRRLVGLTAVVDGRGFVRRYTATYRLTRDRTTVTIVRNVAFVDVGETTVRRPAWTEETPVADGCVPT